MQIRSDFEPNKLLATNKSNAQHNEVRTRMTLAKKTNSLHLNQLNIDAILPEIFTLVNLTRLDLSFNNIVKLSPRIGDMANL
jgi:Leucine-rich repeat (LRR) protein